MKYNLLVFSAWLQTEAWCQPRKEIVPSSSNQYRHLPKSLPALITILHGASKLSGSMPLSELFPKPTATSAFCSSFEYHVSKCPGFIDLTKDNLDKGEQMLLELCSFSSSCQVGNQSSERVIGMVYC